MNQEVLEILKKYWGYDSFRSPQEEIIQSVLDGHDTLALMPTGGGKSICFQVPAISLPGLTLVISPLIALMTDQVEGLKSRGISAAHLISGMSYREMDLVLDNAVNGRYDLLYVSPERLKTELFRERLKRMKIKLIAVDEAHCISQWGFDFRPAYREIKELRDQLPEVPVLALTATATPKVVEDIMVQLGFQSRNLIQKSFLRTNLTYEVRHTERKWSESLKELKNINGSAVVYLRSRRHCAEVCKWLVQSGLSATYYHAGLKVEERHQRQRDWLENKVRIMVSTNAFGMGVDKPDVRLVLHLDIPDSLEAYFQEAGRAGRDGNQAKSVILVGPSDKTELRRRYLESFPDQSFIIRMYQAMANHLQLAVGSGKLVTYDFDLSAFSREYDLSQLKCYHAIQIMEREGLLSFSDNLGGLSRVKLLMDRTTLYDFQLRNPALDNFIKALTRSYGGLEIEYTSISEYLLAGRVKTSVSRVTQILQHLHKQGVLDYVQKTGMSSITYLHERVKSAGLRISDDNLKDRFEERKKRIDAVLYYLDEDETCRSILLLRYFGEASKEACGYCDNCRKNKGAPLNQKRYDLIKAHLQKALIDKPDSTITSISENLPYNEDQLMEVINHMKSEGQLNQSSDRLTLKN